MKQKDIILKKILHHKIIPIIRVYKNEQAFNVASILIDAGIPVLEISLSIPGSLSILEETANKFGDNLLLGAGTVLDEISVCHALSCGAKFIVSPNTNKKVIDTCKKKRVCVFPGALTPTEINYAISVGADAIKVFPCNLIGGPAYIKSLKAPFPQALLFPCGGVCEQNALEYFVAGAKAVFTGSSLVNNNSFSKEGLKKLYKKSLKLVSIIKNIKD
jgi:2-dehydro-3-deoxyphosphogluconate aldolase/(4S)-4-hydroxy-2-oxoglutarate aldolase